MFVGDDGNSYFKGNGNYNFDQDLLIAGNTGIQSQMTTLNSQINQSGTTGVRPGTAAVGFMFFDTTLGYPVFYNGSSWVNASGIPS
jgi:hypothetical protein